MLPVYTDYAEYRQYLKALGATNDEDISRLTRNLRQAVESDITPRQWECMRRYYVDQQLMPDIAKKLNVNVSTVCRNIQRGRDNLARCLRYGAAHLLTREE